MQNRHILDNVIVVQEAVHSRNLNKEKGMVIKLDMENAFDMLRHSFLLLIMEKFGFRKVFISWIKACIGYPWIAPLINGRPSNFFNASWGLRQGCPLSLALYIIMA